MTSTNGETSSASALAEAPVKEEDQLRSDLRATMKQLNRREPLDPNYKRLILNGVVTSRRPVIPRDKFYRRVGSRLRERVEGFMKLTEGKDPLDRISQRQDFEEEKMRAAFTLREAKEHEQQPLLDATMASFPRRNGMDEMTRKRHFEGICLTLQSKEKKKTFRSKSPTQTVADLSDTARKQAVLEQQRKEAQAREVARRRQAEDERQRREAEIKRKAAETPQEKLRNIIQPIFKKLWDMEFTNLGGTNPFRIVIDKSNCAQMGAPDYCDVIKTPVRMFFFSSKRQCFRLLVC